MGTILVVDDESDIREILGIYLENEGYKVVKAENGNKALEILNNNNVDLAILDVMMPGMDGITLCMEIRKESNIPIIMLSAKDGDMDKVMGLTVGADDYVSKPFNPIELIARVKAQLRRSNEFNNIGNNQKKYLDLLMDLDTRRVYLGTKEITLTPKEFAILELLWKNKGKVFSTEQIYNALWNEEEAFDVSNVIMVHIRNLRTKLENDLKKPLYIKTVWGVGYKFS